MSAGYQWPRSGTPVVMGIVNVTPDSFSDGGRHAQRDAALRHAETLIAEGAGILDIGGESTRPGAAPVSAAQEMDRVLPVLEALRGCGVALSVDTSKPTVMRAALETAAVIVNDVQGLQQPGALPVVVEKGAAVCLMHMQGEPRSMQDAPHYTDVEAEVTAFLLARAAACEAAGVAPGAICLDPGFGFGKTAAHNLTLLNRLPRLGAHGYAVLAGLSRKSLIGHITGKAVADRLQGSVVLALLAAQNGASVLRVHDVAATVDALKIWQAVRDERLS